MAVEVAVWETLTVYVPVPPVPVWGGKDICVPEVIPDPDNTPPMTMVPEPTAVTVNVVPEIDPVKDAAAVEEARGLPVKDQYPITPVLQVCVGAVKPVPTDPLATLNPQREMAFARLELDR
jgi:hypothetical protein